MKVSKTFRLSEKAAQVLDQQDNATQYLEDLILQNKQPISRGEALILDAVQKLQAAALIGLSSSGRTEVSEASNTGSSLVEPAKPSASVYKQHQVTGVLAQKLACCLLPSPCKHWAWDESTGEGYINTITGEVRAA